MGIKAKYAVIGLVLVTALGAGAVWFFGFRTNFEKAEEIPDTQEETSKDTIATYADSVFGFEISYRKNPDGYTPVVNENPGDALRAVTFFDTDELRELEESDVPREGPPTISIQVFANEDELFPLSWATKSPLSNLALGSGEHEEIKTTGEAGIRYRWSGLYEGESVVVAHGYEIYLLSVTYLSSDNPIRDDFNEMLASLKFE